MSAGAPLRSELEAEILDWMGEEEWGADDDRFDRLARALFAHQFAHCEPYRRFCTGRGVGPERIDDWREIPAVPTGAFKETALRCFPPERECKVFRTSGTTTQRRGELHLDTLSLYEASLLPTFRRFLLPDLDPLRGRATLRILAPSPAEAPDSSLSHMFGCLIDRFGTPGSGFDWREGKLRVGPLVERMEEDVRRGEPVVLCGTAFAFVHLLERMPAALGPLPLPEGSRIMETGGFKGRAREVPREALHAELEARLGVASGRIVNQYGMTELGSQFYDSVLWQPAGQRRKLGPPWARVRVLDPETGREAASGEVGVLVIHDLANTGSVAAVETADLGRRVGDGFEVLGRAAGAEARGCSVAADAMLGARA